MICEVELPDKKVKDSDCSEPSSISHPFKAFISLIGMVLTILQFPETHLQDICFHFTPTV